MGSKYQGGRVCAYVDSVLEGGVPADYPGNRGTGFLSYLQHGGGRNCSYSDRSCLGGLKRADMLISRVTVFGDRRGR